MLEKMKEIIAEQLSVDAESVTETSSFKEDLGADSLDLFELVMALEDPRRGVREDVYSRRCYGVLKEPRCRGIRPDRIRLKLHKQMRGTACGWFEARCFLY